MFRLVALAFRTALGTAFAVLGTALETTCAALGTDLGTALTAGPAFSARFAASF